MLLFMLSMLDRPKSKKSITPKSSQYIRQANQKPKKQKSIERNEYLAFYMPSQSMRSFYLLHSGICPSASKQPDPRPLCSSETDACRLKYAKRDGLLGSTPEHAPQ